MDMMSLYYYQTNIFCIIVMIIIYLALRNRTGTLPMRRMVFSRLVITVIFICVADIFAWVFVGNTFPGSRAILYISNGVFFAGVTLAGYIWLCYVELRIKGETLNFKKRGRILIIPWLIMLILIVTNPFTKLLFSIDNQNVYSRENGVVIHWIISWFYLIYAAVEVLIRIRKSSSKAEKEQYIPMLWFIIPPVAAAALQMVVYGITSTQCGITLGILIVALNYMIDEVSKDSLTGLNNRKALETTMIEFLQRVDTNVTVLMCDIDKFKSINDTLGHSAGDEVLRRMAEALKRTCGESRNNVFLCRYGGDEFLICGMDMKPSEIEELIARIEKNIEGVNRGYTDNLHFGISVGAATDVCNNYEDVENLIRAADKTMYEKKSANRKSKQSDSK